MRFQCRMFIAILITAQAAVAGEPADPPAFAHARVTDAWEAYRDRLSFGKGQTLALVDDGCTMSMPNGLRRTVRSPRCSFATTVSMVMTIRSMKEKDTMVLRSVFLRQ